MRDNIYFCILTPIILIYHQTMAKKKKKGGQLSLRMGLNDERIPKMIGVLCLFIAFYLFIAFSSYLFTWQTDQDRVLKFAWSTLLLSDMDMANWLGKLGAIVSNMFFYWGFGLPSYIFVFVIANIGLGLIRRVPLKKQVKMLRYSLITLLTASVFLEFIFSGSAFSWGGAFGEGVATWLQNLVGTIGLIVLFLFVILSAIVWAFNPNFNDLTFRQAVNEIKLYITDLISGRKSRRSKPIETLRSNTTPKPLTPLKPRSAEQRKEESKEGSQLQFELPEKKAVNKPETLRSGESELEINEQQEDSRNALSITEENKNHLEPYDPTLDLSFYRYPEISLLEDYSGQKVDIDRAELEANKDQIIETLLHYKIEIVKIRATIGPTVTLYEIVPAPGVRISKIKNLEDDIALSLAALGIRIIAPIPGKGTIGIEVPNKQTQVVSMREVLQSDKFKNAKMDLPIALGKTISNEVFVADLAKMPHLLVAGATGQGKSVGINAILVSILFKKHPSQVKLVLIDPKKVELFPYGALQYHFLAYLPGLDEPIVTETNKVVHTLNSLCIEMDSRYDLLKQAGARNIREYNDKFVQRQLNPEKGHRFLPFIVLVIDEFADLIMTAGKEVELPIGRLAQLARAVGIHLIIATQRPSVNIITGVIKANFPARIAYKVTAKVDSRTILDGGGADQLIGRGDMLLSVGGEMIRLQGAFVDTPEVERVINSISNQQGYPEPFFLPEFHGDDEIHGTTGLKYSDLDDLFEEAARLIVGSQHGSTSMIQRRLKLGYNRAGRIMDQLEALGIVGPSEGSKAREVLIYDELELEKYLNDLKAKG